MSQQAISKHSGWTASPSKHSAKIPWAQRDSEWKKRQQRSNEARRRSLTPEQIATIAALREYGRPFKEIAGLLGICAKALRREWRLAGFPVVNLPARAISGIQLRVRNRSDEARQRSSEQLTARHANNPAFKQKILDAFIARNRARRLTLFPNEVDIVKRLRADGRSISYIAEEIGIGYAILSREMRAAGLDTAPLKRTRRALRGKGYWRSFDPVETASLLGDVR